MKKYKSIITLAILAMIAVFSACSEDGYWDQYQPTTPAGLDACRYSFAQSESANSLDASETQVTIYVNRTETAKETVVPIKATVSDTCLSAPSSVTFKAGEAKAAYVISFEDLVIGETYTVDLAFADSTYLLAPSANSTCKVTIKLNYTWVSLGMGEFVDEVIFEDGGPFKVEILQAEGFDIYRVMRPYNEMLSAALADGYYEDPSEIGKPVEYIEFEVDDDGIVWYDSFATGWLYGGETMVTAYHPYAVYDDPAQYVHNCEIRPGVFQLAPYYYVPGVGAINATQNDGIITITLPSAIQ